jgi:hypothetical protein
MINSLQLDIDEECNTITILLNGVSITISSPPTSSKIPLSSSATTTSTSSFQPQRLIADYSAEVEEAFIPAAIKEANVVKCSDVSSIVTTSGTECEPASTEQVSSTKTVDHPLNPTVVHIIDVDEGWEADGGILSLTPISSRAPNVRYAGYLTIPNVTRKAVLPSDIVDFTVHPPLPDWHEPIVQCDVRLQHLFGFVGERLVTASVYFTSSTNLRLDFQGNNISKGDAILLIEERSCALLL